MALRLMPASCRRERGATLLVLLAVLVIVVGTLGSFLWFMSQQQARAGAHLRATGALAAAEAGVHRALAILEGVAPEGGAPGRTWRPAAYGESVRVGWLEGRFTVAITEDAGGALIITSTGSVAGVTRSLRARVYLAAPALLAALNGATFLRFERSPAAVVILPYAPAVGHRPWLHIAAGRALWLAATDVALNVPVDGVEPEPGPLDGPSGAGDSDWRARVTAVRVALARDAALQLDPGPQPTSARFLRQRGLNIEEAVVRTDDMQRLPDIDRSFFRALAAANTANADLNRAAGRYVGDAALEHKRDSVYSQHEFERLLLYLREEPRRLTGVIYVTGRVALQDGPRVEIAEGSLVAEGTVFLNGPSSVLDITHSSSTRTLPGILALDQGAVIVTNGARVRVHGLLLANRTIMIGQDAQLDIVGSVQANDRGMSLRNAGGIVIIRYDPAVMGTPGLRSPADAGVVAWVASWEEVP